MGTKVYDNYADLITFNRNSKGTALRPIGYGDELVVNGTFDTDVSGWTTQGGAVVSLSNNAILVEGPPSPVNSGIAQQLTGTVSGKAYKVTFDLVAETGSGLAYVRQSPNGTLGGGSVDIFEENTLDPGTHSTVFVALQDNVHLVFYTYQSGGAARSFTIDNVSVKEVLFDREGDPLTLFLHPEGVPRIEYDADRSLKGLLIEPDGQNRCRYSEDISTLWTGANGNTTPTQSTEETPDGDTTNKFIKLVDNNTGGGATGAVDVTQSFTISGGTQFTASVFLKKDGLNWALLQARNTGGADDDPSQYFDLDNGVLGSGTPGIQDATIEAYPNDWYRCSITWTQGSGDESFAFRIYVADADNNNVVDLNGDSSIFFWGAQVEEGPIATSYMPTTSSSFTRDADDALMTNVSGLIGQKEGTIYVEVDWRLTTGTLQYLLAASDGTPNNRFAIRKNNSDSLNMLANSNGFNLFDQGVSSSGFSGIQKFAFAYKTNDFELYRNGSSVADITSGSLAALGTLTDIDLGQVNDATLQANMWIRAVQIIPRRLSDEQLIELTS